MQSSICCMSKPRTSSGIFLKRMSPVTPLARASEWEGLL
jgi:hypothetical protein